MFCHHEKKKKNTTLTVSRSREYSAGHHKVPTSELSASAIFRRSSKQRDECLSPMRADEI